MGNGLMVVMLLGKAGMNSENVPPQSGAMAATVGAVWADVWPFSGMG